MGQTIYTIGHSTRSGSEFVALLREHGVELLVDVRQFPGSRKWPQFGAADLAANLASAGIGYRHLPALGGRRRPQPESENTYWQHPSFRAYADYMARPEFAAGLQELAAAAQGQSVAIMCAEAVPWRCHRQLIADALVDRGFHVLHILTPGRFEEHRLNPRARREPDGHLVYRAEQTQERLFH